MIPVKKYIVLFSLLAPVLGWAQTASPTVYSSAGGTGSANSNFIVDYTVGECVIITLDPQNGTNILTQGFHQPINDSLIGPGGPSDSLLGIYNGLTPNGDAYNEFWYISGIDSLPENLVFVYNRWGDLIWKGEHYDNTTVKFEGKNLAGEDVPAGTYYYVIQLTGRKNYVGWIEVSR